MKKETMVLTIVYKPNLKEKSTTHTPNTYPPEFTGFIAVCGIKWPHFAFSYIPGYPLTSLTMIENVKSGL